MAKINLGLIRAILPGRDLIVMVIVQHPSVTYTRLEPSCLLKILMSFLKEGCSPVVTTTSHYEITLEQTST